MTPPASVLWVKGRASNTLERSVVLASKTCAHAKP